MVKQSSLRRKRSSKRKTSVRRKRSSKRNTSTRRRRSSKRKTSVRRRRSSKRKTSRRRRRSSKKKKSARRKQRGGAQAAAPPPPPPPVGVHAIEINNLIQAIGRRPKNYVSYIHKQNRPADDLATTPHLIDPTYGKCQGKNSTCGYNMEIFKIITETQIQNIVPIVDGIYDRLHVSGGTDFDINSERNILKYTLPNNANIISFGDFHSDIHSLQIALLDLQEKGEFNSEWELTNRNGPTYLVLMGDLVDRGPYGVEIMYLIYNLFIINNWSIPDNTTEYKVFILNGNHEEQDTYGTQRARTDRSGRRIPAQSDYGFGKEIAGQLPTQSVNLENLIKKLPLGLFIKSRSASMDPAPLWYQFCHGGISEAHEENDIINFLDSANDNSIHTISTPQAAKGFMWSDFSHTSSPDDAPLGRREDDRSGRLAYFRNGIERIIQRNSIQTIISGHQDMIHFGVVLRADLPENVDDNKYIWPATGWAYGNSSTISLMGVSDIPWDQDPSTADSAGETTINMKHVSATVMSGAAISKITPVSIYSILHLNNNTSTIRWLPTCNISIRLSLPPSMYNVPDAGNCPAWNSTWAALQAAEAGAGGGGGGAAPPPPPPPPAP